MDSSTSIPFFRFCITDKTVLSVFCVSSVSLSFLSAAFVRENEAEAIAKYPCAVITLKLAKKASSLRFAMIASFRYSAGG